MSPLSHTLYRSGSRTQPSSFTSCAQCACHFFSLHSFQHAALLPFLAAACRGNFAGALCRKEGYETALNYELQNFAGSIWTWGLVALDGKTCAYGSNCTGYLFIVCGKAGVDPNCADDGKGNIGFGNTGTNNVGNYNSGDVSLPALLASTAMLPHFSCLACAVRAPATAARALACCLPPAAQALLPSHELTLSPARCVAGQQR